MRILLVEDDQRIAEPLAEALTDQYGDQSLQLTLKEYRLLELFLHHGGRVLSRSAILENLWSFEEPPGEDALKAHIKRLRQKLKTAGATNDFIETVYGLGYRLKPNP